MSAMSQRKRRVVMTVEHGLATAYATMRFARLGWRVIRIDRPGGGGGSGVFGADVGKEALVLDLGRAEGRAELHRLITALAVDIFCCDSRQAEALGVDHATLAAIAPGLIWAGMSGGGPGHPEIPDCEPLLQALGGAMELTGDADGPPTMTGIPLVALKAGDEMYGGVCRGLAQRAMGGSGQRIDVSMLQAAASWLITTLPLLDFDCHPSEVGRCGNEHRKFIPTNAYPTSDGFMFMAIGNDVQWRRLTEIPKFAAIANERRRTNEGRAEQRQAIHRDIAAISRHHSCAELDADFTAATIPHAPIRGIEQVAAMPALRDRLATTRLADGRVVRLPPSAVDDGDMVTELTPPPAEARS